MRKTESPSLGTNYVKICDSVTNDPYYTGLHNLVFCGSIGVVSLYETPSFTVCSRYPAISELLCKIQVMLKEREAIYFSYEKFHVSNYTLWRIRPNEKIDESTVKGESACYYSPRICWCWWYSSFQIPLLLSIMVTLFIQSAKGRMPNKIVDIITATYNGVWSDQFCTISL